MISCGTREVIRYMCQHKMIDVIVTTGGGIEEDIMKCFNPHYMGDFQLRGRPLRRKGINRIGNLLVPNKNYTDFEEWLMPILTQMLHEQKTQGIVWSPSKIINRLGKEINNPESVYYWCYRNDIPVYCPAITDGSVGDMVFFHSFNHPGFVIDLVQDIRALNDTAIDAKKSGMIILGGGVVKHHICNANLFRNGADFSVFVNTGQEFDGSDSGAKPEEALSWGKIKLTAKPVKVYGDASLIFPLLVAETFAKHQHHFPLRAISKPTFGTNRTEVSSLSTVSTEKKKVELNEPKKPKINKAGPFQSSLITGNIAIVACIGLALSAVMLLKSRK